MSDSLRAQVAQGMTVQEIAKANGWKVGETRLALEFQGLPVKERPRVSQSAGTQKLTKEYLETAYVSQGLTMAEIGADAGVSSSTVRAYLDKHGIATRPQYSKPPKLSPADVAIIQVELERGESATVLAKRFNVTRQAIYQVRGR